MRPLLGAPAKPTIPELRDTLVQMFEELARGASILNTEGEINAFLDHIGGLPGEIRKLMGGPIAEMASIREVLLTSQKRLARFRGLPGDAAESFGNATKILQRKPSNDR